MTDNAKAPLSSVNALKSTVVTDTMVFRWFLYLLSHESAKSDLADDGLFYTRLKKTILGQNFCLTAFLINFLYVFFSKNSALLLPAAILLLGYIKFSRVTRQTVAALSLKLIEKHFSPAGAGHLTLYQIGERLANRYRVKSLVMSMTSFDKIVRGLMLLAFILVSIVFPLNVVYFWGFLVVAYWAVCAILNTTFIYTKL